MGLVALVWHKNRRSEDGMRGAKRRTARDEQSDEDDADNADNVQRAGIAAGLAVLSAGCPTCGTTLLMPVIGAISSTGGYAIAGVASGVVFVLALIVALLALKKVGLQAYVIMINEKRERRKHGAE